MIIEVWECTYNTTKNTATGKKKVSPTFLSVIDCDL